ncbi:hypothetical protein [Allobranchiibius sp. GilTou38]|uniref:hypothetical protein n=1 Tax=Allobranchiibius sp. GilTou38 TaxID=2815210 RepID=UPI001AA12BBB|nr:hypothetical protein [Allobranchiibius sp. GilTou38]MBO1768229.1 hypothetical protein [Allobranchiibius sp. GilTou38]
MTALQQVHDELDHLERRRIRRQKVDAIMRPPKDPSELLQTEEARTIRAGHARRQKAFEEELRSVRALVARMEAGGPLIVAEVTQGWRAWCEDCGAMSPVCATAGGAGVYRHDCYSQTPPAADETHF